MFWLDSFFILIFYVNYCTVSISQLDSVDQTLSLTLGCPLRWHERWPESGSTEIFLAVKNGLAGSSGTWKEHDWKMGDSKVCRRGVWMDLSQNRHKLWRCLYPMWMPKGIPLQRRFIIRQTKWCALEITVSLFPSHPRACSVDPWIKEPWWHRCRLCRGLGPWTSHPNNCSR